MVDPKFDCYANIIKIRRDRNVSWNLIDFFAESDEERTEEHLSAQLETCVEFHGYPAITVKEWHELVRDRKESEESGASIDDGGLFVAYEPNNEVILSERTVGPNSCWQQYRKKLRERHFTQDAVERLEAECKWIVNRICLNTQDRPTATKGLVVGNVQSGKTANMAGVIAMAADIGFNLFVVLSGRVTNLRTQTSGRLIDDVKSVPGSGGLDWTPFVEMLRPSVHQRRLQDFYWTEMDGGVLNKHRYLTVCLKEPNWLKNLMKWLQADSMNSWINTGRVKMLIIDDECDQASVNTRDVESELQTTIFKYILGLCNHMTTGPRGSLAEGHEYAAVNYLGYTATPYANILNDADPRKSLYPRDFIKPLKPSPSYWGPSQIFGTLDPNAPSEFSDRPFLCEIAPEEVERVKGIHKGEVSGAPESLKEAIGWFVCASAVRRLSGTKSPVSMLVHTSNAVSDHAAMAGCVSSYLSELREQAGSTADRKKLLVWLKALYIKLCNQLTLDAFTEMFIEYEPKEGESVRDYPAFSEIEAGVLDILSRPPTQIEIAQEDSASSGYVFSEAIHLCVDNSDNNANINNGDGALRTMRIHYPTKYDQQPLQAPLFIVVGGNTLARGLTIEGLVSTYFLRTVRTCDSLMQMGRWFGYRFGFELLPRIWMTSECVVKFAHLTRADVDLRRRLEEGVALNKKPVDMQACMIDTSEAIRGFTVTSKNKMQMAEVAEADYSCTIKMPYWFATDAESLAVNRSAAVKVLSCGQPLNQSPGDVSGYWYMDEVPYQVVEDFLKGYAFCPRAKDFADKTALLEYLSRKHSGRQWTVIVSGTEKKRGGFEIAPRNYSNLADKVCPEGTIVFKHVTEPADFIADIDPRTDFPSGRIPRKTLSKAYRCAATLNGKDRHPVLVLTRFNSDNLNVLNKAKRLTLAEDIYGFALYLPSVSDGELTSYTKLRCRNLTATADEPESEI